MASFIDSHAHLVDAAFDSDRDAAIERARQTGCRGIVAIGTSPVDSRAALELAHANAGFVYATAGHHPHEAVSFDQERDGELLRELLDQGAVAVGECGLDYHYDHSPRDAQLRAFSAQLALAAELRKPVVVHTREAESDMEAMIREAGTSGVIGVLHCFTGPARLADTALAAGWYVSFAGIVTFRKWDGNDLIRAVPGDRILVESDSPYLAPVPHRGKRNEPAYVSLTLAKVAEARGSSVSALGSTVTANARRLFALTELAAGS
ncbi:MAG: TatD family hydrolase [Gemmatimonadaceae bacterium]|nr:TatD family hydrolase [Gemmatimonadaceae bacterium]